MDSFKSSTKSDLRELCKANRIRCLSRLKKEEIVSLLMDNNIPPPPKKRQDLTQMELVGGGLCGSFTPTLPKRDLLGKIIPINWSIFNNNPRRCINCENWRKKKLAGDFVCVHIRGYKEAPAITKRCNGCEKWKKEKNIRVISRKKI